MGSNKYYPIGVLLEAMKEAGASWCTRTAMYHHERAGRLRFPRAANGRGDRLVTEKMIEEIIEAFLPGGKGEWDYEKR